MTIVLNIHGEYDLITSRYVPPENVPTSTGSRQFGERLVVFGTPLVALLVLLTFI